MLGVILAGGKSRRFGSPKAFAKKCGLPFYQYSIDAIKPHTASQLIITSTDLIEQFNGIDPHIKVAVDHSAYQGKGPLAGIYTAMDKVEADWYLTAPVDVPFVKSWVFKRLLEYAEQDVDAVVAVAASRKHPLIAVYHSSVKNKVKEKLDEEKLSVQHLLESIRVKYVPIEEEQPFININRQIEYEQFVKKHELGES